MIPGLGPSSSVRMRTARIPPSRNEVRIDTRYMTPIRLWSSVKSQDRKPWAWVR